MGICPDGEMNELGVLDRGGGKPHLGDDQVSVVQRSVVEVDEDIVVTKGWDVGFFVELEAVEARFALNGPLLGC